MTKKVRKRKICNFSAKDAEQECNGGNVKNDEGEKKMGGKKEDRNEG